MSKQLQVLSLNSYIMGHITHQDILERTFQASLPEINLSALHLIDDSRQDLLGRIFYRLLTPRLPWSGQSDADFYRCRNEIALSLLAQRCLKRAIANQLPDVLHIHTQSISLLVNQIMRRIPTLISLDCTTAILQRQHPAPAQRTYQPITALESQSFRSAAHIVSCSDYARQSVIQDYGIPAEKVTTIPYGLPLELFNWPRHQAAQNKVRLLFVGNDFKRKGGEDVVAVFLEQFAINSELDIVSNDSILAPDLPNLRIHRQLRPLSPQLLSLYQQADIFVMPTYEDVYGVVFIEAMAAGLPCIGTPVMAVPELVQHGKNGFTIPAGDRQALAQALHQLVNTPELRQQMGQMGRAIAAERFNAVTNCKRLAQLFERIQKNDAQSLSRARQSY